MHYALCTTPAGHTLPHGMGDTYILFSHSAIKLEKKGKSQRLVSHIHYKWEYIYKRGVDWVIYIADKI